MTIVAVTACTSGVAHTYMAAQLLLDIAKREQFDLVVETQGALGIENPLSDRHLEQSEIALLITDIEIEGKERFEHHRVVHSNVTDFIQEPQHVFRAIARLKNLPPDSELNV